jgi:hypothetical protein
MLFDVELDNDMKDSKISIKVYDKDLFSPDDYISAI